jgi:hypothetical protein
VTRAFADRAETRRLIVGLHSANLAVPWHLATAEWTDEVKRVLKPNGLYALNVIDQSPFDLQRAETATVLDAFAHVRMVTYGAEEHPYGGNAVLLASDRPIPKAAESENKITTSLRPDEVKSLQATPRYCTTTTHRPISC